MNLIIIVCYAYRFKYKKATLTSDNLPAGAQLNIPLRFPFHCQQPYSFPHRATRECTHMGKQPQPSRGDCATFGEPVGSLFYPQSKRLVKLSGRTSFAPSLRLPVSPFASSAFFSLSPSLFSQSSQPCAMISRTSHHQAGLLFQFDRSAHRKKNKKETEPMRDHLATRLSCPVPNARPSSLKDGAKSLEKKQNLSIRFSALPASPRLTT